MVVFFLYRSREYTWDQAFMKASITVQSINSEHITVKVTVSYLAKETVKGNKVCFKLCYRDFDLSSRSEWGSEKQLSGDKELCLMDDLFCEGQSNEVTWRYDYAGLPLTYTVERYTVQNSIKLYKTFFNCTCLIICRYASFGKIATL